MAFRFSDKFKQKNPDVQQKWIQTLLRSKEWQVDLIMKGPLHLIFTVIFRIVPNYELPPALEKVEILRVVIRENITEVVRTLSLKIRVFELTVFLVDRPTYQRHCEFITFFDPYIILIRDDPLRLRLRSNWQSLNLLHTD